MKSLLLRVGVDGDDVHRKQVQRYFGLLSFGKRALKHTQTFILDYNPMASASRLHKHYTMHLMSNKPTRNK